MRVSELWIQKEQAVLGYQARNAWDVATVLIATIRVKHKTRAFFRLEN
jgi:hypothetical protein